MRIPPSRSAILAAVVALALGGRAFADCPPGCCGGPGNMCGGCGGGQSCQVSNGACPSGLSCDPTTGAAAGGPACAPGCCGGPCGDCPGGQACRVSNGACASGLSCDPTAGSSAPVSPAPSGVQWGVNIDPKYPERTPTAAQASYLHPAWVRYEVTDGSNLYPDIPGASRLLIFDYASVPVGYPKADATLQDWTDYINGPFAYALDRFLNSGVAVDALEVWNEEDDACVNGPSGYCPTVPPEAYAGMMWLASRKIKARNPAIRVVMGGLDSGDPSYVQAVRAAGGLDYVDAVALHPYGRSLNGWTAGGNLPFGDFGGIVAAYASASGKPVWVSETSLPTDNQALQKEYLERLAPVAANAGVPVVVWFGFSDKMNANYGLVDGDGKYRLAAQAFHDLTGGSGPPPGASCLPGCCGGSGNLCGGCPGGQSCSIANGACASGMSCGPAGGAGEAVGGPMHPERVFAANMGVAAAVRPTSAAPLGGAAASSARPSGAGSGAASNATGTGASAGGGGPDGPVNSAGRTTAPDGSGADAAALLASANQAIRVGSKAVQNQVDAANPDNVARSATRCGSPPPAAPRSDGPDAIDLSQALFAKGANISAWPITSRLRSVSVGSGQICAPHSMAGRWPRVDFFGDAGTKVEGNLWIFAYLGGRWVGGAGAWLRPGQTCHAASADQLGPDAFSGADPLSSWSPCHGEYVGFAVSTPARAGQWKTAERSNVVVIRWP